MAIQIYDTDVTFEDIYEKEYFPKRYESDLKRANVLLIPTESFRDYKHLVFPEGTEEFLNYTKLKSKSNMIIPDICISDEDYRELQLHNDFVRLPDIITTALVFPVLAQIIGSYLYDKIKLRKRDITTQINITVESTNNSKKVHFEGNAKDFEKVMNLMSKKFKD